MLIYLLFISVLILFFIALVCYDGEILSPPAIICATFLVSIMAAIYNIEHWNLRLCWKTYGVIVGGLTIFVLCGILLRILYARKMTTEIAAQPAKKRAINVSENNGIWVEDWKLNFYIICVVVISILYYLSAIRIVRSHYGIVGWTESMDYFRKLVSYGGSDEDIPMLIKQCHQMINYLGYVCIYIVVYNFVYIGKIQKRLLILCIVTVLSTFLTSGRLEFLIYIICALTVYDLLLYQKNGKAIKCNVRFIMKACVGMGAFCVAFVMLKQVVGRIDTRSPFYYITFYCGQSIYNLNEYLQETHTSPTVWGKETFYGLNHLLKIITGNEIYDYISHKEFRFYRGESIGNVYTTFRAFIHDFGYAGYVIPESVKQN